MLKFFLHSYGNDIIIILLNWREWPLICLLDSAGPLSPRAAAALKQEIEKERAQLMATKDMAESEKNKAQDELTKREKELKSAQEQHEELHKKLEDLQSKVMYEYSLAPNYGVYQRFQSGQ